MIVVGAVLLRSLPLDNSNSAPLHIHQLPLLSEHVLDNRSWFHMIHIKDRSLDLDEKRGGSMNAQIVPCHFVVDIQGRIGCDSSVNEDLPSMRAAHRIGLIYSQMNRRFLSNKTEILDQSWPVSFLEEVKWVHLTIVDSCFISQIIMRHSFQLTWVNTHVHTVREELFHIIIMDITERYLSERRISDDWNPLILRLCCSIFHLHFVMDGNDCAKRRKNECSKGRSSNNETYRTLLNKSLGKLLLTYSYWTNAYGLV